MFGAFKVCKITQVKIQRCKKQKQVSAEAEDIDDHWCVLEKDCKKEQKMAKDSNHFAVNCREEYQYQQNENKRAN